MALQMNQQAVLLLTSSMRRNNVFTPAPFRRDRHMPRLRWLGARVALHSSWNQKPLHHLPARSGQDFSAHRSRERTLCRLGRRKWPHRGAWYVQIEFWNVHPVLMRRKCCVSGFSHSTKWSPTATSSAALHPRLFLVRVCNETNAIL